MAAKACTCSLFAQCTLFKMMAQFRSSAGVPNLEQIPQPGAEHTPARSFGMSLGVIFTALFISPAQIHRPG